MADRSLARSFEDIGEEYDRYRPGFPPETVSLVVPAHVATVLDLGAGTGKFTRLLVDRTDRLIAVEPSERMLDVLRDRVPAAEALSGSAEAIPLDDAAVDAVTVAQAFHWFDRAAACAEIVRVLKPHGILGLLWNRSDPDCAWDVACHRIAHPAVDEVDATTDSAADELPGFVFHDRTTIRWIEPITREAYVRRWMTVSSFLVADDTTRARMVEAVETVLHDDPHTRGRTDLLLPQLTDVYLYRRA